MDLTLYIFLKNNIASVGDRAVDAEFIFRRVFYHYRYVIMNISSRDNYFIVVNILLNPGTIAIDGSPSEEVLECKPNAVTIIGVCDLRKHV